MTILSKSTKFLRDSKYLPSQLTLFPYYFNRLPNAYLLKLITSLATSIGLRNGVLE